MERAIGRIKQFGILKSTLPLTMARIANQIVSVCAYLVNFQPALIPPPIDDDHVDITSVAEYFEDFDSDSSIELSDDNKINNIFKLFSFVSKISHFHTN